MNFDQILVERNHREQAIRELVIMTSISCHTFWCCSGRVERQPIYPQHGTADYCGHNRGRTDEESWYRRQRQRGYVWSIASAKVWWALSVSWSYAASQLRGEGTGRAEETVLTKERVKNSVGEVAASIKVKRWISMRWLTKWPPSWKGQQVARCSA